MRAARHTPLLNILQGVQALELELQIGADICSRIVDYAVQAANTVFLQAYEAAQYIGLGNFDFTASGFYEVADTACDAAYRGALQLLGEFEAAQDHPTFDASTQAIEGESCDFRGSSGVLDYIGPS